MYFQSDSFSYQACSCIISQELICFDLHCKYDCVSLAAVKYAGLYPTVGLGPCRLLNDNFLNPLRGLPISYQVLDFYRNGAGNANLASF